MRHKTLQTGLVVSESDFARVLERVAELERGATVACREIGYMSGDDEFKFKWGYADVPNGNVVIGPIASYDDKLGYPYLTGNSDRFSDLLDEMGIAYTEADVYVYTDDSSIEYVGEDANA